jgi:hypothetical protein
MVEVDQPHIPLPVLRGHEDGVLPPRSHASAWQFPLMLGSRRLSPRMIPCAAFSSTTPGFRRWSWRARRSMKNSPWTPPRHSVAADRLTLSQPTASAYSIRGI